MTAPARGPSLRIGVDTGGTFTDIVALDTRSGRLATTKTPSTPADPAEGFLTGINKILDLVGAGPADIESILHGDFHLMRNACIKSASCFIVPKLRLTTLEAIVHGGACINRNTASTAFNYEEELRTP